MPRIGVFGVFFFKFIIVTCVFPMSGAQATVYYVDQKSPAASDANPGTEVAPWLSLTPITQVKLLPGDIVLVKEGIYRASAEEGIDQVMINPQESGKKGKPITFKSSPAYAATLKGGEHLRPVASSPWCAAFGSSIRENMAFWLRGTSTNQSMVSPYATIYSYMSMPITAPM